MREERRRLSRYVGLVLALLMICIAACAWSCTKKVTKTKTVQTEEEIEVVTCPFCGRAVTDTSVIDRRPVAIKVENTGDARPQSGLDKACIVMEEIVEGGITRFMAIYLDQDADPVGPVRSARPMDIDMVYPFSALFAHCGGSPSAMKLCKSSGIPDLDEFAWTGAYWRWRERRPPHNLYTSTQRLREAGATAYPFTGPNPQVFEFLTEDAVDDMAAEREEEITAASQASRAAAEAEAEGKPAPPPYQPKINVVNSFTLQFNSPCRTRYDYDVATGKWLRYVQDQPHTDLTTGAQLAADTIIVQYLSRSTDVIGMGRAQVFVMGRVIEGTWTKGTREELTEYTDEAGNQIPVKPGNIWIELITADRPAEVRL